MKKLIIVYFFLLPVIAFSQSLENTEWQLYIGGTFERNVRFGIDTFYVDLPPETAFSTYSANLDTFKIVDLDELGCNDFNEIILGTYLFQIQNDTLTFSLIDDECEFRVEILDTGIFTRIVTATNFVDQLEKVMLFPNPIENGILNIETAEPLDLILVYDLNGRILFSTSNTSTLDFSKFSNNIFIVVLKKDDKISIRKIFKL